MDFRKLFNKEENTWDSAYWILHTQKTKMKRELITDFGGNVKLEF